MINKLKEFVPSAPSIKKKAVSFNPLGLRPFFNKWTAAAGVLLACVGPAKAFETVFMNGTEQASITDAGWHMINPQNAIDLNTLLENEPNIHSIWGWDRLNGTWKAKFRNPTNSSFPELTSIEEKQGVWVKTTGSALVPVGDNGVVSSAADLHLEGSGWYLKGSGQNETDVIELAESLEDGSTVWSWKDKNWQIYTKGDSNGQNQFNIENGTQFGNLRTLDPYSAFWIHNKKGSQEFVIDPDFEQQLIHECQISPSSVQAEIKNSTKVTKEMVEQVVWLNCDGRSSPDWTGNPLTSIEGINAFVNLELFWLDHNSELKIIDISKLTKLKDLHLSENGLEEIIFGDSYPDLKKAIITYNQLKSITLPPAEGVPQLTELALYWNLLEGTLDLSDYQMIRDLSLYVNWLSTVILNNYNLEDLSLSAQDISMNCDRNIIGITQEMLDKSRCGEGNAEKP